MVDIKERLCTPEQAKMLKEYNIRQISQYAWQQEPNTNDFILIYDAPDGFPEVVDWTDDENTYAAFDNTDLGLMLASLGYYPSGPTFKLQGTAEQYKWWCDDINTFNNVEDTVYQGYGSSEAEAKAAMLLKLFNIGKIPLVWQYYHPRHLEQFEKEVIELKNNNKLKPDFDDSAE